MALYKFRIIIIRPIIIVTALFELADQALLLFNQIVSLCTLPASSCKILQAIM